MKIELEQYKGLWKEYKSKFRFFKSPELTYLIISVVFYLLGENKLVKFVKAHQAKYNRLTTNTKNCPNYLKQYQKIRKKANNISKDYIKEIITKLKYEGKSINSRTVAEKGSFDYSVFNYGPNKHLRKLIEEANKDKLTLNEVRLIETIKQLEEINEKITLKAVAEKIGVGTSAIYGNPRLFRYFEINQKMNPSYIPRIKKAIKNLINEGKRINKKEISRRAKISDQTIRKYSPLNQIVIDAISNQKHPKYDVIKEKINLLKNSGVIITRELIEEETGLNISIFYDYDELRELLEAVIGDNLKNHKIRLNNAFKALQVSNTEVTISSLLKESGLAKKTLYGYEDLVDTAKEMVRRSTKRKNFKQKPR